MLPAEEPYAGIREDFRARAAILCGRVLSAESKARLYARISRDTALAFSASEVALITLCHQVFPANKCIAVALLRAFTLRNKDKIAQRIKRVWQ